MALQTHLGRLDTAAFACSRHISWVLWSGAAVVQANSAAKCQVGRKMWTVSGVCCVVLKSGPNRNFCVSSFAFSLIFDRRNCQNGKRCSFRKWIRCVFMLWSGDPDPELGLNGCSFLLQFIPNIVTPIGKTLMALGVADRSPSRVTDAFHTGPSAGCQAKPFFQEENCVEKKKYDWYWPWLEIPNNWVVVLFQALVYLFNTPKSKFYFPFPISISTWALNKDAQWTTRGNYPVKFNTCVTPNSDPPWQREDKGINHIW